MWWRFSTVLVLAAATVTAQEDDLSKAFGRPEPPKVFEPEHNVPPPPLPEDFTAPMRANFERDFEAAKKQLDSGDAAGAREALVLVDLSAVALGGPERVRVAKLQRAAAEKLGEKKAVAEADAKWLGSCGPYAVEACRESALKHIETYDAATAKKMRAADECLLAAEKNAGHAPPACLASAQAVYRKADDLMMVSRVELLKAQALAADRKQVKAARAAMGKLAKLLDDRTAHVRRAALETLSRFDLAEGNVDAAVNNALLASQAWAMGLPPHERAWARSPALDAACEKYESTREAGACRKLEKKVLGDYVFHDFSDEHIAEGHLLSKDQLVKVNEHYNVLVHECLQREIQSLDKAESFTYRVKWLVITNGHVDNFHAESNQLDQSRFVKCLRNQFGYWRYPSHEGDPQQIVQTFSVKSTTHSFEETEPQ